MKKIISQLREYIKDATKGLPEEIFLFSTEITPMVNVDLVIRNNLGEILLSWREDEYCGQGWHIPGGIVRYKELLEERIDKVALEEVGCRVITNYKAVEVKELVTNQSIRGHFISFIYECRVPEDYQINNKDIKKGTVGFLEWHKAFPDNMVPVHAFYKDYF